MKEEKATGTNVGTGRIWEVYPGEDYRQILPKLQPGDELVFHEGVYEGPAVLEVFALPDKPIIIRGYGNGEARPVFLWEGKGVVLWSLVAEHVILDYLEFQSTYVYAVRLGSPQKGVKDLIVQNCVFRDCNWNFSCNYSNVDYEDVRVLNNQFIRPKSTPVYIGHHAGITKVSGFVFEGNFIDGSRIVSTDIIGYGIELKLNVKGAIVRNNLIANTKGPGIMVYGAENGTAEDANIVEENIVMGSRINPGIEVGAGPSVVRRNIVLDCAPGGICVADYGGRRLIYDITVSDNTCAGNGNFDLGFYKVDFDTPNMVSTGNLALSKEGVTGFKNMDAPYFPGEASNNKSGSITQSLTDMIKSIKTILPDMDSLKKIWPRLKQGPFDAVQLEDLLAALKACDIN